ncbi:outer membrane receptor for ferric coprogen and ferric-rhodotorulic acid [Litorivivens lipolytica]|uniref:Outer membrane receptor for ferric coprogen and ferric-rhodotorulic acid n=1 Tax=Litorivivens lipolytica TaxID=1524264 RepID=A0A7W4W4P9_9GAMM|nr:TonB-dependent siderophore receptor [Litorivivens lipolytica]MBB3047280.1 outer membrane receptor for ferric coprogen and ferric-rhodotorulic acid [Litorivivens lipolytica]
MKTHTRGRRYWAAVLLAGCSGLLIAKEIETVTVYGQKGDGYLPAGDSSATRLGLSALETPQSISTIGQDQMRDFGMVSLNQALDTASGVQVQRVETDRTYYTARGFDITNFQIDGVGLSLSYGNRAGELDTAIYERIDVVRGPNGLMAGAGNPSASINLVRKRPFSEDSGRLALTAGSWDRRRLEGDVSVVLGESTRLRAVAARESRDSYLDRYSLDIKLGYLVVEQDIGDSARLTFGGSFQSSDADRPLWGALPLYYTDGSQTDYDTSTSTSSNWSYWDTNRRTAFIEYAQTLAEGWQLILSHNANGRDGDSELFYVFGQPDPVTEQGLTGYASAYTLQEDQGVTDAYVSGRYSLAGREHEIVFGANWARNTLKDASVYDFTTGNGFPPIDNLHTWDGNAPYPTFADGIGDPANGSNWTDRQQAIYVATRYRFTDNLSLTAGARTIDWESEGRSYGEDHSTEANGKTLPYAGLLYRFADDYTVYTSYTETFMPQRDLGQDFTRLDPNEGRNIELGVKGELFGGRMLATAAVFRAEHDNTAEAAGNATDPVSGGVVRVYRGVDFASEGLELEVSGYLAEGLRGNINFTVLQIEDDQGDSARHYVPKRTLNASLSYQMPGVLPLRVGGGLRWQDDTYMKLPTLGTRVKQGSYALLDLFAQYAITDSLTASLNIGNVTDEKYITSLYWEQGFYGAPRNSQLTLSWAY